MTTATPASKPFFYDGPGPGIRFSKTFWRFVAATNAVFLDEDQPDTPQSEWDRYEAAQERRWEARREYA